MAIIASDAVRLPVMPCWVRFLGEYGEKGDQVLAENIPIKTVVNTPGVGILTCEQRQRRAREVGAEIAKEYTVR